MYQRVVRFGTHTDEGPGTGCKRTGALAPGSERAPPGPRNLGGIMAHPSKQERYNFSLPLRVDFYNTKGGTFWSGSVGNLVLGSGHSPTVEVACQEFAAALARMNPQAVADEARRW